MPPAPPTVPDVAAVDVAPALGRSIARLARLLRQQDDGELSPTLGAALWTIGKEGPLTLGELAARERVAPPTVTKLVDKLESRGLVERLAGDADRRVRRVAVTPAGRELLDAIRRRRTVWFTEQLERLRPDDLERLAAAADVLEALTAAPGHGRDQP